MIVGRDAEVAAINTLLAGARSGQGGALVVLGEPGIGKTALLDAAARTDGFTVVRTQGFETESELAFAALRDLLADGLGLADQLPSPQRTAVLGALAMIEASGVELLSAYVGTLGLLSLMGRDRPLLALVDDHQWLDAASASALAFVARRLADEPIAMLIASRDPVPGLPGALQLAGLTERQTTNLARARLGRELPEYTAEALHRATGGNPLAVLELLDQPLGTDPFEPLPTTALIEARFNRRLDELSAAAQRAALVAAVAITDDAGLILDAASRIGSSEAAVFEAEAAGILVAEDGRVRHRHPLLRSAVYSRAGAADRRRAHAALAEASAIHGYSEGQAWHAAAAALAPDEGLAAALEAAAARYEARSGHLAAARALHRAARLSPTSVARGRRLVRAADAARRAGRSPWARDMLDEAGDLLVEPSDQLERDLARTMLDAWSDASANAHQAYARIAADAEGIDPDRAALAYGYATAEAIVSGNAAAALSWASRAERLRASVELSEPVGVTMDEILGRLHVLRGEYEAGEAMSARAAAWYLRHPSEGERTFLARNLLWIERYDSARALLGPALEQARRLGDLRALTDTLEVLAELDLRTGDWTSALASAAESVRLAEAAEDGVQLAFSLSALAMVQAYRGEDAVRDTVARLREVHVRFGLAVLDQYAGAALGHLALAAGQPGEALRHLEPVAAWCAHVEQYEPAITQWAPDLIEARALAGDTAGAAVALVELERRARTPSWAAAAALRCRGLLADGPERDDAFEAALSMHERIAAPFERARTHLAWGRRLRRDRRRVDARVQLTGALERFEALGSKRWAEVARSELGASGETLRSRDAPIEDTLTAHELQIAMLVARGASNKDVAGSMFLSPKTIETHLSRIYRKLGVRSRSQLALALRDR